MFAVEPIEPDEFVIEYVGETVRVSLADARERLYQVGVSDVCEWLVAGWEEWCWGMGGGHGS
jgi:hypothetical protein